MTELDAAARLAIAALVGLGVGVEREWSGKVRALSPQFAGLRTLMLLGLIGGSAGLLLELGHQVAGAALIAGAAAVAVAAYARSARPDPDATTEVAAVIVVALGAIAGIGLLTLAAGAGTIVVLALSEKQRLHRAVEYLREEELRAALRFSVLALVVLPLLPAGPLLGPIALRPRALWIIVLFFCALNFAGFIARRVVGARHGHGLVGMLGGLISSTAVTLDFSRRSRREPAMASALASGVIGASTVLIPRILVVSGVLNLPVAIRLLAFLGPVGLVGAFLVARSWRSTPGEGDDVAAQPTGSPLRFWMAIRMAVAFQAAMVAIDFVRSRWAAPGLYTTSAVLGLTDLDALTVGMSRTSEPIDPWMAARAISVGILANTMFKLTLSASLGGPGFRRPAVSGLGILGVVTAATLLLL